MIDRVFRAGTAPARLAIRAALALRRRLLALADAAVPPQLVLFEQGMGLARTQLLHVAAQLRIADRLEAGPLTADALARETGANPDALFRALRALAAGGVFTLLQGGRFENNRASRALRADGPGSMRALLQYLGSAPNVAAWADAGRTVQSGKNAFERVHGMSVWDWFTRYPDEERTFADAMGSLAELDAPAIATGYPFGGLDCICDVAGGRGAVLAEILRQQPRARGVLFDAPQVVAEAPSLLARRGVADRVTCVGGSFFESVPEGCDIYLLRDVLHDWDDAACLRILATCRRAAPTGARLLVAEVLAERECAELPATLADVQMMVICQEGRQRSAAEHQALLARAGFRPGRVSQLAGTASLVEGIAR